MPRSCAGPIRGRSGSRGAPAPPPPDDAAVRVVVVRHGERLDEVDREAWRRLRNHENRNDPPLTPTGWEQGRTAGRAVAAALAGQGPPRRVTLYSSPTVRTLATAAAIAPELQLEPGTWRRGAPRLSPACRSIVPVYALNCCAAAKNAGVAKAFPQHPPEPEALAGLALACWPPQGDPKKLDARQQRGGSFVQAVVELAAAHEAGEAVVLVTHREGMWELQAHMGERLGSEYCCVLRYALDLRSGALCAAAAPAPRPPRRASPSHGQAAASRPIVGSTGAPAAGLPALLERGSGRVRVAGGEGVRLWRTPGVLGAWLGEGPLPAGEELELLSGPQSSEGAEGEAFVLVGRASGERGWLRVADICAPPKEA